MNTAPIQRYSQKAPPNLRGLERLIPNTVKPTGDTWTVHRCIANKSWEHIATFKDREDALHHARTLNALETANWKANLHASLPERPRRLSEDERKRRIDEQRLGSKIIFVIFVVLLPIWKLVQINAH